MKATKQELLEVDFAPERVEYPFDEDGKRRMASFGLRLTSRFALPDGVMAAPQNKQAVLLGMAAGAVVYLYNHDGDTMLLAYLEV
jgi:hypothetical protein